MSRLPSCARSPSWSRERAGNPPLALHLGDSANAFPLESRAHARHLGHVTDYRVAKNRCPTTIHLVDGQTLEGDVFLDPVSRFRPEPQQPTEFFNASDPFFVLATADARILVARELVARAVTALPESDADDSLDAARVGVEVEVSLAGDHAFRGWIFPEITEGRARLVDFLNALPCRFLEVCDDHNLILVNRKSVTHIREL
jgi:hypothetical protein